MGEAFLQGQQHGLRKGDSFRLSDSSSYYTGGLDMKVIVGYGGNFGREYEYKYAKGGKGTLDLTNTSTCWFYVMVGINKSYLAKLQKSVFLFQSTTQFTFIHPTNKHKYWATYCFTCVRSYFLESEFADYEFPNNPNIQVTGSERWDFFDDSSNPVSSSCEMVSPRLSYKSSHKNSSYPQRVGFSEAEWDTKYYSLLYQHHDYSECIAHRGTSLHLDGSAKSDNLQFNLIDHYAEIQGYYLI